MSELLKLLKYTDRTYRNFDRSCFIKDNIHHAVLSNKLWTWNILIIEKKATLTTPPTELSFMTVEKDKKKLGPQDLFIESMAVTREKDVLMMQKIKDIYINKTAFPQQPPIPPPPPAPTIPP